MSGGFLDLLFLESAVAVEEARAVALTLEDAPEVALCNVQLHSVTDDAWVFRRTPFGLLFSS